MENKNNSPRSPTVIIQLLRILSKTAIPVLTAIKLIKDLFSRGG